MKKIILITLTLFLSFNFSSLKAQDWNWHGNDYNSTVKEYIWGTIQKMNSSYNCSGYAYGKSKYQKIDVYSYTTDGVRIRFNFKFFWQIDYMLMSSNQYSFTLDVSCMPDGCNARVSYQDETGGPDCSCSKGYQYDLGCLYGY